tara:strand:- start:431 stop:784 length:354 start_codon:yes stop_codon:yes gene_type:complete
MDNTITTLNKKHTLALKKFMTKVDETVYYATEEMTSKKFIEFQDLKQKAIGFSNEISAEYIKANQKKEWIMMLPNFMIFSVIGFLTGLNNNKDNYVEVVEDLYDFHISMIDEFRDIC